MKYLVANWKMNPGSAKAARALAAAEAAASGKKSKIIICPPFVYIPELAAAKHKFDLGSQDIFWEDGGAHTGQISGPMLKAYNVKYAIIGHSEKRALGETDEQISRKVQAALDNKITPLLCTGFGAEKGMAEEDVLAHIQRQLSADLRGADCARVFVAYEPVWAIGTGKPATPEHAERVCMFIKIKFGVKKILYGGSTNSANAAQFLFKEIDGLLVGGASLDKNEFVKMSLI